MIPEPGLYTGTLRHRRFRPQPHHFTYNLFMAWMDIDRIPWLMTRSRWSSYERFNWASFSARDHFGDPGLTLRERVIQDAKAHGVSLPDGPIYLLTHLRYLGYCFNPISLFFCYDRDGGLDTVLAEVRNTFGESHNYWLSPQNQEPGTNSLRYRCAKQLHVSPFMPMNMSYEFVLTRPGEHLIAHMNTCKLSESGAHEQNNFDATLTLRHEPWTSRALTRALLRFPWMTAKVIAAIHWEAFRLHIKGAPFFRHPGQGVSTPAAPSSAP